MRLRCLIVDDDPVCSARPARCWSARGSPSWASRRRATKRLHAVERQRPDVTLVDIDIDIDIDLGEESGLDLTWRLAHGPPGAIDRHPDLSAPRFAELVESSPAIGFVSKSQLSAGAIRAPLEQHRDTRADGNAT